MSKVFLPKKLKDVCSLLISVSSCHSWLYCYSELPQHTASAAPIEIGIAKVELLAFLRWSDICADLQNPCSVAFCCCG
jgi:hypothetical protein